MSGMNLAQKAVYALVMVQAAADELLDVLDDFGHALTPIENSTADFAGMIAQHMAERVALTPQLILDAQKAGEQIAVRVMAPPDEITPESHQLPPIPDRSLN